MIKLTAENSKLKGRKMRRKRDGLKILYIVSLSILLGGVGIRPSQAEDSWTAKTPMPTERLDSVTGVVNGKIYVIGGWVPPKGAKTNKVEVYDPATDTWTEKASMPQALVHHGAAVVNNKIYVIGGEGAGGTAVFEYDPLADSWTIKAPAPTPRYGHSIGVVNNKIYVIGGFASGTQNLNQEYAPATDSWTTKAPMPTGRDHLGIAVVYNKIYAIGGRTGFGSPNFNVNEEYDPATNTWTTKAPMPTARAGFYELGLVNNKIYVMGGEGSVAGEPAFSENEEYNPATNTWSTMTPLPIGRHGMSVGVVNNKIYTIGGGELAYYDWGNINEEYTPPFISQPDTYEGFGVVTRGAEDAPGGYTTYHITHLTDDQSGGSLTDALSQGSRYIVFDVGGTIHLQDNHLIKHSYITIDGSTAPYPGITIDTRLKDANGVVISSYEFSIESRSSVGPVHDVIINNLRILGPGAAHSKDILAIDGTAEPVSNIIIDNCTADAAGDGIFEIYGDVSDVTVSWNLITGTVVTSHISGATTKRERISVHHNVYAKNNERQIKIVNQNEMIDFVNNVVYGWSWIESGGKGLHIGNNTYVSNDDYPTLNVENNYYKYLVMQHSNPGWGLYRENPTGKIYFNGNIFPEEEDDNYSTSARHVIPAYAEVTTYDASTLGDTVVPYAGTHYPTQEEQDLLNEISTAIGGQPGDNTPPVAIIQTDSTSGQAPLTVNFDASTSSDPDGSIASYSWDFNNDGVEDSAAITASYTYNIAGTYTAVLTVTDDAGAQDTDTVIITVIGGTGNTPPDISAIPDTLNKKEADTITSSEIELATDLDGDMLTYTYSGWLTSLPYTTTSSDIGIHTLHVDVSDGTDTVGKDITITVADINTPPVAIIQTDSISGEAPLTVTFDASGSYDPDADGSIVSYSWDFGDGSTSTGMKTSHIFTSAGEYTVTLTVTDDHGWKGESQTHIIVFEKEFGKLPRGCYNNVFNPAKGEKAIIVVELPKQSHVRLNLYNTRGKRIRELADEQKEAGTHKYYWYGKDDSGNVVGSGLYFVHIQAGDYKKTKKIVVIK